MLARSKRDKRIAAESNRAACHVCLITRVSDRGELLGLLLHFLHILLTVGPGVMKLSNTCDIAVHLREDVVCVRLSRITRIGCVKKVLDAQ